MGAFGCPKLALASAEVAAAVAAAVLRGDATAEAAHLDYARALAARVQRKRAFNRVLRDLVASPRGVVLAARVARAWPGALQAAIRYAGDAWPGSAR